MTTNTVTKEDVLDSLKTVYDPEIPVNLVDLGLIYGVEIENGEVKVQMTLTARGCGMGTYIAQNAESAICDLEGVEGATVELVWDPPWSPDLITSDGKKLLGLDDD